MRNSVGRIGTTGLVLMFLALGFAPAMATDTYPKAAVGIPDTSILPNKKILPVPEFIGQPAEAKIVNAPAIPQNPYMGIDPWSTAHNDSYMSDTYPGAGPLGRNPVVSSTWFGTKENPLSEGGVATFDTNGLMVAAVSKMNPQTAEVWVQLTLIDPNNLDTLATLNLPSEFAELGGGKFRPAGTYFYQDELDRTIIGTPERTVWVVSHSKGTDDKWSFNHDNESTPWNLKSAIPDGDSIEALQPDWTGRLWFTSKGGVVGTFAMLEEKPEVIGSIQLSGERIINGHAAGEEGGVYIVTTMAMYRFDADSQGRPMQKWRKTYDAGTHVKEGQVDTGSGTTPTLMGDKYVTITDNGQPRMHVLVYSRDDGKLVCSEPVFRPGSASNENSLIATDKSIIVENNFGYKSVKDTTHGRTTKPGMARVDVEDGACRTVWTNESVSIPTVVSKMSLATGLIYTYTKPKGPATTDPWYFTAIDFHTGKTVWKVLAGRGLLYNNHYAPAYLDRDGALIVGVIGGFVKMKDGE